MNKISELHRHISDIDTIPANAFGSSLIIAPHPDDETLGCGGTAALLRREGIPVHYIFVSDGSMSHPNSKKFPAKKLTRLREKEAKQAVKILGGTSGDTDFLRLKDSQVPHEQDSQFFETVKKMVKLMDQIQPETVFVPWQKDPHCDHQATWKIMTEAMKHVRQKPRFLQYPIWYWERGNPDDMTLIEKMQKWSVNIEDTLEIKNKALAAHVSQVTHLIDDDPEGFMLSEQVIAHFNIPRELFFESAK